MTGRPFLSGIRWVTALLLFAGCSAGEPDGVTARDSAGIGIVEAGPPLVSFAAWDGRPVLEIGVVDGERDYQFDRITGLARLSDGTVVVADAGAHDVRAFGTDGRLRWRSGRAGEGPGEFGGELALARMAGDTLAVYDWLQRRLTFLGPDGSVAGVSGGCWTRTWAGWRRSDCRPGSSHGWPRMAG